MASPPRDVRPLLKKVAVVTGATRGIGRALAETFAQAGCDLALCARTASRVYGEELSNRHGVCALAKACDVRDEASVAEFFSAVRDQFGRVDILVNNAGMAGPMAPIEKLSFEDWRAAIDVNLTGTFLCTRAALPLLSAGGVIANNLSVAANGVFAGESAYVAAKHGARGFTQTLREEVRERGIRVIALYPGPTDTDIWDQFWPEAPREKMMSADTVAQALLQAILLPPNATVEELVIGPTLGRL